MVLNSQRATLLAKIRAIRQDFFLSILLESIGFRLKLQFENYSENLQLVFTATYMGNENRRHRDMLFLTFQSVKVYF